MPDYNFDNIPNTTAKKVAENIRYRDLVNSVDYTIDEDGTTITTMFLQGGFQVYITAINDEFGGMFNIIGVRTLNRRNEPLPKPSIIGRESGDTKDIEKEIRAMLDKNYALLYARTRKTYDENMTIS